jgi:hypothetical protein
MHNQEHQLAHTHTHSQTRAHIDSLKTAAAALPHAGPRCRKTCCYWCPCISYCACQQCLQCSWHCWCKCAAAAAASANTTATDSTTAASPGVTQPPGGAPIGAIEWSAGHCIESSGGLAPVMQNRVSACHARTCAHVCVSACVLACLLPLHVLLSLPLIAFA